MTNLEAKYDRYTYLTILHRWLRETYGKASECENKEKQVLDFKCEGKPKRFEYTLIKGKKYKMKRENFIMLCPSCHRKYDYTEEQRSKFSKRITGNKFNTGSKHGQSKLIENEVLEIRKQYKQGEKTQKELAMKFGVNQAIISRIVNFKKWKHI